MRLCVRCDLCVTLSTTTVFFLHVCMFVFFVTFEKHVKGPTNCSFCSWLKLIVLIVFLEAVNRELNAQFSGSLWSFRGKVKIDTVTQVSVTNSEDRIRVSQLEFPGPETRPKTLTSS